MKRLLASCMSILLMSALLLAALHSDVAAEQDDGRLLPKEFEGVYLLIDKHYNVLSVYLNNHEMYRFPVATGRAGKDTPEGLFRIVTKVKNPWYLPKNIPGGAADNPLGTRWMGLDVPGTGGYEYGLHGTNNPSSIGGAVSSGCIRMRNDHIEWLYEHIPLETPVIIRGRNHS